MMRGTVHLVTAGDCLSFRPVVQPVYDRSLATNRAWASALAGLDLDEVQAEGRALVEQRPRTPAELGAALAERWPGHDPAALAYAVRCRLPLVQVPPRGLWGASGRTTCTTAESWLGLPVEPAAAEDLVLRYLAAFGPATVPDVQAWSGLTRLGEVVQRLRSSLVVFGDERGRELFDLPEAPRPDPQSPAPVRFLPEYDNLLLSHADRARVVSDEDRRRLMTANGVVPGTFLVDGAVRGAWKIRRTRAAATLTVTPFRALSRRATTAIGDEGARLLRFAAAGHIHDIQIVTPD